MYHKELFGFRLHKLRKSAKETQADLAELLGVSSNQISEIERGRRTTTFEKLSILCEHYNVCSDYLLGLTDEPRPLK